MTMTNLKGIFRCETDNGRKFKLREVLVFHNVEVLQPVLQVLRLFPSHMLVYIIVYTHCTALHSP
jgi:hypothetical protein